MPWEYKTVEEVRKEFVSEARKCCNFSLLCREFGVTRKTGYKWLEKSNKGESLLDMSRKPLNIPNKTPEMTEQIILDLRSQNPAWGGKTIKQVLENKGYKNIPCAKTITNILNRHGCISPEEAIKHKAFIRFAKEECNEMWQTDFKGEFLMADNKYCYPLTILDDHSRFSIKIVPHTSTANVVMPSFRAAFIEFGVPDSILSDNGSQFAGFRQGFTQFEKWLMNHNVLPIHGRVKHPQTQGKIERFHRTLKYELLKHTNFRDIDDADVQLQHWRDKYNTIRPHEALGMKSPSQVYVPSTKTYMESVCKYDYSGYHPKIKVNSWGYVRYAKHQVYLSETMANEVLEFRESHDNISFIACYRNFKIAEFAVDSGNLIHRKISRL